LERIDRPDHLSACHFKEELAGETSKFADEAAS
jgi:hypothetical protein